MRRKSVSQHLTNVVIMTYELLCSVLGQENVSLYSRFIVVLSTLSKVLYGSRRWIFSKLSGIIRFAGFATFIDNINNIANSHNFETDACVDNKNGNCDFLAILIISEFCISKEKRKCALVIIIISAIVIM